jgi:hypothetical protein
VQRDCEDFDFSWLCGVTGWEQFDYWFQHEEIRKLIFVDYGPDRRWHVVEYEVPEDFVSVGRRQVCFDYDHATVVRIVPREEVIYASARTTPPGTSAPAPLVPSPSTAATL